MSGPNQSSWVARTFTRARVVSRKLTRIPFSDQTLELPFTFNRVQLWATLFGLFFVVAAWGVGSALGAAKAFTFGAAMIVAVVIIALGRLPIPERGAGMYIEGYLRALWLALPFTNRRTSSRERPERSTREHLAFAMSFHASAGPAGGQRQKGGPRHGATR